MIAAVLSWAAGALPWLLGAAGAIVMWLIASASGRRSAQRDLEAANSAANERARAVRETRRDTRAEAAAKLRRRAF